MALALLLTVVASVGPGSLPRGNDLFRLGMTRAEVDSVVAGRALTILSDGTAFLVTGSDDTAVEFEQYSFFLPPHGTELLWKVTIGYRVEATRQDLDRVRVELEERLGPPAADSDQAPLPEAIGDQPRSDRQVMWWDESTQVRLGGRWTAEPDKNADRMMVTWTDRHIQKLIEARRKKNKPPSSP